MNVLIRRADGGISIMSLAETVQDVGVEVERWSQLHAGQYVSHRLILRDEVLPDRVFRNAWTDNGDGVVHDMTKAREIVRDKLRLAREPKLAALDVEFLRAAEKQDADALNAIAEKKNKLRDITADTSITNAKTVKGLTSALTKLVQSIGT